MTIKRFFLGMLCALSALFLAVPVPAAAQSSTMTASGPTISGFNVGDVGRLRPGAELAFTLWGSPGGIATLHINGATRNLTMVETEPGQYEGTYIIGTHDRIAPDSTVRANLRLGNSVASTVLADSLVHGGASRMAALAGPGAKIDSFNVEQAGELTPGNELVFAVHGTAGARVQVSVAGARGVFFLPEVSPGVYRGSYTIRHQDRIAPDSAVTASLRAGNRIATANLGQSLLAVRSGERTERLVRVCTNCATVEAVNVVTVSGEAGYLGSQVGGSGGTTERSSYQHTVYEVRVRYAGGGSRTLTYENDPGFRIGEKVKVNNGVL
ncbi:MAG TPA: hypothetical protein VFF16_19530, partial [Telluria sp.]|nr:hypothetical protein [Telluria sp.]